MILRFGLIQTEPLPIANKRYMCVCVCVCVCVWVCMQLLYECMYECLYAGVYLCVNDSYMKGNVSMNELMYVATCKWMCVSNVCINECLCMCMIDMCIYAWISPMNVFVVRLAPMSLSGWMVCVYVCLHVCIQFFLRFTQVCHRKGIKMPNAVTLSHQNFNFKKIASDLWTYVCMYLCVYAYKFL